ncbi:MAG: hypothetical protein HY801_00095 [Candidatus Lindowbacteria bacterium]|nr:hypothetical protein [Candidatus Lindowbacteria bacterium]
MNDPLEYIEKLAARARQEEVPQGDVSRLVFGRLHESEDSLSKPMLLFAAGYAAAAFITLAYGLALFNMINDPLSSVFQIAAAFMY